MSYYFPTTLNREVLKQHTFHRWVNTMNAYEILRCKLMLPQFLKLYRADTICPAPKMPFVDLGYFKDQHGKVEVIIQSSAMQHEISLEDYYTFFAQQSGETIVKKRLIDGNPDQPDMLMTRTFEDGQTWITRRTGLKTWMGKGAFVVTLNLACHESVYNSLADVFFYMQDNFRMIEAPSFHLAEELRLFSKRYPLDFATYVPFSWQEDHSHFDTQTKLEASFKKSYRGNVTGLMSINALSFQEDNAQSKEAVLGRYLSKYSGQGLDISKMNFTSSNQMKGFHSEVHSDHNFVKIVENQQVSFNIKIYLAQKSNVWFYLDMMGYSREQDFEVWAINKRTIQLALQYLKTG